ncbi:methyltransferase family protein [Aureliella helgolandensis]|uniref:Isoprenylcysteine carboxyl methyltransferase (ICMT) family protein n=1 Tax=Aureliella helgolandensis TaxID=2527968 RepID=A0A518G3C3_9BACT|nr:isoprenylcysteine carboxylmethyltransferase family protein [Aureliella helgolandensis]QDV23060.1 Isoprenylcysteine carboxyl methyltransferase (ICMT) family protein [Aureliella helgolandensis]
MNEGVSASRLGAARLLVGLQFIAASVLVLSGFFNWRNGSWQDSGPTVVAVIGILLGIWAIAAIGPKRVSLMPAVTADTQLVTAGPYRFIRHPMYAALLLFCGALVFAPFHFWKVGVWGMLLIVLMAKSRLEERQLMKNFPDYAGYMQRTWRFVPLLW